MQRNKWVSCQLRATAQLVGLKPTSSAEIFPCSDCSRRELMPAQAHANGVGPNQLARHVGGCSDCRQPTMPTSCQQCCLVQAPEAPVATHHSTQVLWACGPAWSSPTSAAGCSPAGPAAAVAFACDSFAAWQVGSPHRASTSSRATTVAASFMGRHLAAAAAAPTAAAAGRVML